jgi:hypothetical protein
MVRKSSDRQPSAEAATLERSAHFAEFDSDPKGITQRRRDSGSRQCEADTADQLHLQGHSHQRKVKMMPSAEM